MNSPARLAGAAAGACTILSALTDVVLLLAASSSGCRRSGVGWLLLLLRARGGAAAARCSLLGAATEAGIPGGRCRRLRLLQRHQQFVQMLGHLISEVNPVLQCVRWQPRKWCYRHAGVLRRWQYLDGRCAAEQAGAP